MNKLIVYLLLLLPLCSQGQQHLLKQEYKYRLSNGIDLLLVEDPNASETTMFLTGKLGPFLEDTTTDGAFMVCFELLKAGLKEQLGGSATVEGYMHTEYFMIELSGLSNNVEPTVETIQAVFTETWWDSTDLEAAKLKALQHASTKPITLVGEKLSEQVWANEYCKMSDLGPPAKVLALDSMLIDSLLNNLYCPSLLHLAIHSSLDHRELRTQMILLWNDWLACRVPYSVVNFVPSYRPIKFSLKNLIVSPVDETTYLQLVQGPAVFNGKDQLRFGLLIGELLGLSDTVAMLLDSLHLKDLELEVKGGIYASELWLQAKYAGDSTIAFGEQAFQGLIDSITDTTRTLFTQAEMAKAKAVLVDQLQDTLLGVHRTMLLSKHWAMGQQPLATNLGTELDKLKPVDMVRGLSNYFNGHNNASALVLPDSSLLSAELVNSYTTTHLSVLDHVFNFKKNTGQFADSAYEQGLNELFQFMKSNTFSLQVVGLSSKEELDHVTDADMVKFFKDGSMPYIVTSGRKAKRDNIPLELYRVMVVMRYLIERGINPDRLIGTGMRLPKKDPFYNMVGIVHFQIQY